MMASKDSLLSVIVSFMRQWHQGIVKANGATMAVLHAAEMKSSPKVEDWWEKHFWQ
jgi:hypothetical protein